MAWVQLGNIGTGLGNPLSVMYNIDDALVTGNNGVYKYDLNYIHIMYKKYGANLSTILSGYTSGVVKLFTLKDGSYLGLNIINLRKKQSAKFGYYDYYQTQLIRYSSAGSSLGKYGGAIIVTATYDSAGTLLNNHFEAYMSIAMNDETKEAHIRFLGPYYNNENVVLWDYNIMYNLSRSTLYTIINGDAEEYDTDPWANGGYGDIGGGDGELDLTCDVIALPELPTSFTETGFVQIFSPTLKQVKNLSEYMWQGGFIDNVIKLWNNPMDIILNLAMFPFTIPVSGSRLVHAGNVITNVSMNYPPSQYVELDCGTIDIKHFYNAYLDYDPYTTCEIFLPYIGVQTLSMDDIMGKKLNVRYRIDLISGSCGAYILCDGVLYYSFSGVCSTNIPVSGQSFTAIAQSAINIATAAVGIALNPSTAVSGANSIATNVMSCKPSVQRAGSLGSNVGMVGPQKPYLIFSVPRTCLPKRQNKYLGYPSFTSVKLSELSGYTEIENIRLENISCTEEEKNEIYNLLKGGVIL